MKPTRKRPPRQFTHTSRADARCARIEPAAFYSVVDILIGLGIGPEALRRARRDGSLRFIPRGGIGGRNLYRGRDLIDWLVSIPDGPPPLTAARLATDHAAAALTDIIVAGDGDAIVRRAAELLGEVARMLEIAADA
jgi:hypothetical protein